MPYVDRGSRMARSPLCGSKDDHDLEHMVKGGEKSVFPGLC